MEQGGPDPGDDGAQEKAPPWEEDSILRYEEHIMALLVTVAQLHSRVERLQQREEEEAREEGEVSDFCSEYTASLPRGCLLPFPNPATIPAPPPPPAALPESPPDPFLAVHEAVSSLEKTVSSHRSCIPSAEAELEGLIQAAEGLEESLRKSQEGDLELLMAQLCGEAQRVGSGAPGDRPGVPSAQESEAALCQERNRALWLELAGQEEELRRATAMLHAYREEREKLQRKVKELQRSLSEAETLADGAASPLWDRGPGGFQTGCPALPQSPPPPEETGGQALETHTAPLRSSLEALRGHNQRLSGALQEAKGQAEGLSMALGQQEADHSALRWAAHYSECCLEAYEVLWGLTLAERGLSSPGAGEEGDRPGAGVAGGPCLEKKSAVMEKAHRALHGCVAKGEELLEGGGVRSGKRCQDTSEEKQALRGYIRYLRTAQAALKLPTPRPSPVLASMAAGIGAQVAEAQRASQGNLPTTEAPSRPEKGRRLQELQATRESLAELNARLHLAEKEKQGLELQLYTFRAQEAAFLLMVRILRGERAELLGPDPASSSSSSSSSGSEECGPFGGAKRPVASSAGDPKDAGPDPEAETRSLELLQVSERNRRLQERIRSLVGELEESSQEAKAQEVQQVELTWDFFKAHRGLVLAFLNARKKQEAQIRRLEAQRALMGQHQAGQMEKLSQTLRGAEGRRGRQEGPPNIQPS